MTLGQNIVVPKNTPLCNAWLTLLRQSSIETDASGDSTGLLEAILA